MDELLCFLYESCQELGLIRELLKLPLGLNEQVAGTSHVDLSLCFMGPFFA